VNHNKQADEILNISFHKLHEIELLIREAGESETSRIFSGIMTTLDNMKAIALAVYMPDLTRSRAISMLRGNADMVADQMINVKETVISKMVKA
jgi:hypothetical protein